jgi:hypothetical protein
MTFIVGILCTDGVVVASDSDATFGTDGIRTIGQQAVKKIHVIEDSAIYASTGAIGISQVIRSILKPFCSPAGHKGIPDEFAMMNVIGAKISQAIQPYFGTGQALAGMGRNVDATLCKSMLAFPFDKKCRLFTFDYNGAPEAATEELCVVTLGSGQLIGDPFLAWFRRAVWRGKPPTLAMGRQAAVMAVDHVRNVNPGGVGGDVQLSTLQFPAAKQPVVECLKAAQIEEHRQLIEDAVKSLVEALTIAERGEAPPAPPKS